MRRFMLPRHNRRMLRLAPSKEPLWRTPSSLQLGADPAIRVDDVTPWQESLLSALHDGIPDAMILPLAAASGAPAEDAAAFVEHISPALTFVRGRRQRTRVELPGELGVGETDALLGALDAVGLDVVSTTRWAQADPDPAVPVVIVAHRLVEPRRAARLMARDVTHLPIELAGDRVTVGPLVVPGVTACLACVHAHRRDADPAWPLLAAQMLERGTFRTDLALLWEAGILAGRLLSSPHPQTASVTVSAADVRRSWHGHRPHAECWCRSPEGIATSDEVVARSPATTTVTEFDRPA